MDTWLKCGKVPCLSCLFHAGFVESGSLLFAGLCFFPLFDYMHIYICIYLYISVYIHYIYSVYIYIYLVGGFKHFLFSISYMGYIYMGCHPSHWRTPSCFKMGTLHHQPDSVWIGVEASKILSLRFCKGSLEKS